MKRNKWQIRLGFLGIILVILIGNNLNAQSRTEILILGTNHLNQLQGFKPSFTVSVIEALDKHNFDVVGIEKMPTELLNDIASRNDSTYFDLLDSFGNHRIEMAEKYQNILGNSFVQVQKEIKEKLRQESFTNSDRVELIRLFLAAGDLASSTLQLSYIDEDFVIEEKLIDAKTIAILQKSLDSKNEIYSIGLKIAKRQGLNRFEYIDNLQDEPILLSHFPAFISDYLDNKHLFDSIPSLPIFIKTDSIQRTSVENGNLLPLYRFLNGKEFQEADFEAQWKLWLTTNFSSKADLSRYALWEMRNLQIAANIMKLAAFYPSKRILIIIGASHKSFLEKYLSQSPNVELLKLE